MTRPNLGAIRSQLATVSHVCPPRGEVWLLLEPDCAPPLPSIDTMIRDLARRGAGQRGETLLETLRNSIAWRLYRAGVPYAVACEAVERRRVEGRLVWRDGGLVPWAAR